MRLAACGGLRLITTRPPGPCCWRRVSAGDLNSERDSEAYKELTNPSDPEESIAFVDTTTQGHAPHFGPTTTFTGFYGEYAKVGLFWHPATHRAAPPALVAGGEQVASCSHRPLALGGISADRVSTLLPPLQVIDFVLMSDRTQRCPPFPPHTHTPTPTPTHPHARTHIWV